mgnify:CR=1 FL=1
MLDRLLGRLFSSFARLLRLVPALFCRRDRGLATGPEGEGDVADSGKNRVQQHQRVYQALGDRMKAEIHALSMRTLTPDEYKANPNG